MGYTLADSYLYRIYTEDKDNTEEIATIMEDWGYDGFTLIYAEGYWQGVWERSLIIELMIRSVTDSDATLSKIRAMAWAIGSRGAQQEVLVTQTKLDYEGTITIAISS